MASPRKFKRYDTEFPPLVPPSQQQSILSSEIRRATPPIPPGLEHVNIESRRSTPTVPPGLSRPTALPDLESPAGSRPSSRASMKRTASQITPAIPLRPATPVQRSVSKAGPLQLEGKVADRAAAPETPTPGSKLVSGQVMAKADAQERPSTPKPATPQRTVPEPSGPSVQDIVPKAEPKELQASEETEPTDKTPISTPKTGPVPHTFQPASKGSATVQASETQAIRETPTKQQPTGTGGTKRTPPGKLDIAAASSTIISDTGTPSSSAQRSVLQTPVDAPKSGSPGPGLSSPAIRTGPKTLRLVSTPKTETPPTVAAIAHAHSTPSAARLPSRQPSIASIQMPGTPSSEHVSMSDNISMPSTSQSRASSPPPTTAGGKGSSVVPIKTKNQLKKERQERAKAMEEEKKLEEEKKVPSEEPAQEAIISRKKKTKKEKEPKIKPKPAIPVAPIAEASAPGASTASSPPPGPAPKMVEEIATQPEPAVQPAARSPSAPSTPTRTPSAAVQQTHPPPPQINPEPSPPPTPTFTAAQLIAELKATAPEIQKCIDSLFRAPTSHTHKPATPITARDLENDLARKADLLPSLSPAEVDSLLKGVLPALRYGGSDKRVWSRGMVTPTGAHLRALTEELEARFLELEKAIQDLPEELRFRATKPQNELKFPAVDLQGLKRGFENVRSRGVNVMEQVIMMQQQQQQQAQLQQDERSGIMAGRAGGSVPMATANVPTTIVDDVNKYINEFVMPPATPPPNGSGSSSTGRLYDGTSAGVGDVAMPSVSVDLAERQLNEARRVVEEREAALKKMMKKNRKVLGLS